MAVLRRRDKGGGQGTRLVLSDHQAPGRATGGVLALRLGRGFPSAQGGDVHPPPSPQNSQASGLPLEGGLPGALPFSTGSFAVFLLPSNPPFPKPHKLLSWHLWNALEIDPQKSVSSSQPWDHGGCWHLPASPRTETVSPACFFQGSLPRGGKAAFLDLISLAWRM